MKKPRTPGSGRKKGSYSFCNITLEQLNSLLRPTMNEKVARKWAVDLGLVESDVASVPDQTKAKVNLKETNFDDDDKTRVEVKETEW